MRERSFGMVVGGRYPLTPEEGKQKFLIGSSEIGVEGLGGFESQRLFKKDAESLTNSFSILAAAFQGISPYFSFCPF
jgi:hypothetical protein